MTIYLINNKEPTLTRYLLCSRSFTVAIILMMVIYMAESYSISIATW